MVTYEAWFDPENVSYTLAPVLEIERQRSTGLLSAAAEFLYRFDAATHEEAMAIHHLRLGYEPYRPVGEPRPCPDCQAWYYPDGSAVCWRCGPAADCAVRQLPPP
jgi:hypothetical protein